MSDIEKKLIKKSMNGDVASFETLINQYQKYAYNIAYRMMGNEEDAKDAAQDALIKVYRNLHTFKMDSTFSTWLYRIVMNTCKDALRKRKDQVVSLNQEIETNEGSIERQLSDKEADPLLIYEKMELKEEIGDAINQLKAQHKEVVVLKDLLGYSYDEISQIVDVPIGTVRSRLNRGREQLKDILKSNMGALRRQYV